MKKFLALVLALIMTFSIATVAFATETTTEVAPTEEAGALDWLLDLPFWTLGPASWIAKMALKLVKVFVKIAAAFKIIESTGILDKIQEIIDSNAPTVEESTTAAAVLA